MFAYCKTIRTITAMKGDPVDIVAIASAGYLLIAYSSQSNIASVFWINGELLAKVTVASR